MFYRYETSDYGDEFGSNFMLELRTFISIKETRCGFWIANGQSRFAKKRWVSKTARKRFAYPTKQEALDSYIARAKRAIGWAEYNKKKAQSGLTMAEVLKKEEQGREQ